MFHGATGGGSGVLGTPLGGACVPERARLQVCLLRHHLPRPCVWFRHGEDSSEALDAKEHWVSVPCRSQPVRAGKRPGGACLCQPLLPPRWARASWAFSTGQSEPLLIQPSSAWACGGRGPTGDSAPWGSLAVPCSRQNQGSEGGNDASPGEQSKNGPDAENQKWSLRALISW